MECDYYEFAAICMYIICRSIESSLIKHNRILTMSDVNGAIKLLIRPANDGMPSAWLLRKMIKAKFNILIHFV